jgi:hypothetical protein
MDCIEFEGAEVVAAADMVDLLVRLRNAKPNFNPNKFIQYRCVLTHWTWTFELVRLADQLLTDLKAVS